MSALGRRAIALFLPAAVLATLACGLVYAEVQQSLRSSANDPQYQLATDAAVKLDAGASPASVVGSSAEIDLAASLAPFVIVFDRNHSIVATNASLAFTNTGLNNGTLYYYVVHAVNACGESADSAEVSARPASTASTQVSFAVVGNQLQMTWPADHTGWRLQAQTNSLDVGLGTNWSDVSGSAQTNMLVVPLDRSNGAVFFRLVWP